MAGRCFLCDSALADRKGLVTETDYWCVLLHHNQAYFGRCTVILKRHCEALSELENDEWMDLRGVVAQLEGVFRASFGAAPSNWTCLMNGGYRVDPPIPHVHLHFRPRYRTQIHFGGITFSDPEFGSHYDNAKEQLLPDTVFQRLVAMLKKTLEAPNAGEIGGAGRQKSGDNVDEPDASP